MQFTTSVLALLASAGISSAAMITFHSLDSVQRTVYFTGSSSVDPVTVAGNSRTRVEIPDGYVGNAYSVKDGEENVPGMLAEFDFSGWNGLTYFDVSAIVNPNDHDNVHEMWPHKVRDPVSGCKVWPCDNAYWHPDDVQTKTTESTHLVVTLGGQS